ncbi:hypothetical protein EMPG_12205 [Blastomyces silverae]|uniref:Uncharacterized protein n=1 Tax=Blastomyces silverae TaxID=2060906 RepID=A0A0H1BUS9_9EURO|nr:hypothetical protein EMPG_12205 [Blastomyces silverae]
MDLFMLRSRQKCPHTTLRRSTAGAELRRDACATLCRSSSWKCPAGSPGRNEALR